MFRPIQDTQQVLGSLREEMNKMFERVWHVGVSTAPLDGQQWAPAVDIYEYDDRYVLFAELPGLAAECIEVHQVGDRVTLRGEKRKPEAAGDAIATVRKECRYGQFCRTIDLPPGTAADRITAKVRSRGLSAVGSPRGPLAAMLGAQLTGIRLWTLAGSMFLDGMARLHGHVESDRRKRPSGR